MTEQSRPVGRVIGLDAHPDSFTAAILRGLTPAAAVTEKICNKVPLARLKPWAQKNLNPEDVVLLEASGNSFHLARTLIGMGYKAKVLESCHLGRLKEAHANNDKISAVRIGKAYLAGTAKEVWIPDAKTQERRDVFHAHRKAVKRTTQAGNSLLSYLSDNGVRLPGGTSLAAAPPTELMLRAARQWTPRQWQVLQGLLLQLRHAQEQRDHWRSLIAQEVLADPELLRLVRLCGVRDMVAFALGAFIGDIKRFADPKKLVKYVGLNPAFDDSGQTNWSGGIGGHGNKHLRCLLMEGAQAVLRSRDSGLAWWGKRLLARKGPINLVAAAVARKMTVAVWYLMMGRWTPLEQIDARFSNKLGKIITQVGLNALESLGQSRPSIRAEAYELLKTSRPAAPAAEPFQAQPEPGRQAPARPKAKIYVLNRPLKFTPKATRKISTQPCPST